MDRRECLGGICLGGTIPLPCRQVDGIAGHLTRSVAPQPAHIRTQLFTRHGTVRQCLDCRAVLVWDCFPLGNSLRRHSAGPAYGGAAASLGYEGTNIHG